MYRIKEGADWKYLNQETSQDWLQSAPFIPRCGHCQFCSPLFSLVGFSVDWSDCCDCSSSHRRWSSAALRVGSRYIGRGSLDLRSPAHRLDEGHSLDGDTVFACSGLVKSLRHSAYMLVRCRVVGCRRKASSVEKPFKWWHTCTRTHSFDCESVRLAGRLNSLDSELLH